MMADSAVVVAEAEQYVIRWQEKLGFQNWRIIITAEEAGSNSVANCAHDPHYRKALIRVDLTVVGSWNREAQLTGELLELAMLHELIHLFMVPVSDLWDDELNTGSLWKRYTDAQETVVDELTSVIWRLGHRA